MAKIYADVATYEAKLDAGGSSEYFIAVTREYKVCEVDMRKAVSGNDI